MPIKFRRLRITGFKSFAEPTSVDILPGLTGIVGPNGCGKSNIVEALRWAMGESSARNLRGGEMDDVIFAGTSGRAARNIAEVALFLDDALGVLPPPFDEAPDLQVSRRLERGKGSLYRINGKEARFRDVQTLFADLSSGARASAMVSQGRVATLVNAKPTERRAVLEEAAGITGLHARRHESELKLHAAEANLARADDARAQFEAQLASLKRQARMARRYRNISDSIRTAQVDLLAVQCFAIQAARIAAETALREARSAVAEAAGLVEAASIRAGDAATALPALRESEAQARTNLERHRIAQEHIAKEVQRARAAAEQGARYVAQLRKDLALAIQNRTDTTLAQEKLSAEREAIVLACTDHPSQLAALEAAERAVADEVTGLDAATNRAAEELADTVAHTQTMSQRLREAEQRAQRLRAQFARVSDDHARLVAQRIDQAVLDAAGQKLRVAEAAATAARTAQDQAEQARIAATAALATARERLATAESVETKLSAEIRALTEVISAGNEEHGSPMIDFLTVPVGLEMALGAALGEELFAAVDTAAARHWRALPPVMPVPALPSGAEPLSASIAGVAALDRVLSHIGLVEDDAVGEILQPALSSGQVLVSRSGGIWRWDGFTVRAGTPTPATVRLQQRNRLISLSSAQKDASDQVAAARASRGMAETESQSAAQAERQAGQERRNCERLLDEARSQFASLNNRATLASAQLELTDGHLKRVTAELQEAEELLQTAQSANANLPDTAGLRACLEQFRAALEEARNRRDAIRRNRDRLIREQELRSDRLNVVAAELVDWTDRNQKMIDRIADLELRVRQAESEQRELENTPGFIAIRRATALDALDAAERAHRGAAEILATSRDVSVAADRDVRLAEARLAECREELVRAESGTHQADHSHTMMAEKIADWLGPDASVPEAPIDVAPDSEEKARRRLERLQKERDEMGPVNLRAEAEAEAVEQQIATIDSEREEISTAIARLRGLIGRLNHEGRDRLTAIFKEVDQNFQQLFSRMFGGGRAHLALVGSDDPLTAGLEIFAQPPGKKLSTLSLLSGGEQALTALSLIFAVFRCNPAPICVLDEVDAPLDDTNVERFCQLLADMDRETKTRFLVVTHHPVTMARMDRLYGVTMQERGVSRLLSVNLREAEDLLDTARLAAE